MWVRKFIDGTVLDSADTYEEAIQIEASRYVVGGEEDCFESWFWDAIISEQAYTLQFESDVAAVLCFNDPDAKARIMALYEEDNLKVGKEDVDKYWEEI